MKSSDDGGVLVAQSVVCGQWLPGKCMADNEVRGALPQGGSHGRVQQDEAARLEAALARIQAACSGRSAPVPAFLGESHQPGRATSVAGRIGAPVPADLSARLDALIAEIRGLLAQGL